MIYAGKAWDWKGIHIFLKAAKVALMDKLSAKSQQKWSIKLIGIRFEEEQKKVMGWVDELGLQNHVTLIPFIQRSELLKMLANCSLSVYPAFRDSGDRPRDGRDYGGNDGYGKCEFIPEASREEREHRVCHCAGNGNGGLQKHALPCPLRGGSGAHGDFIHHQCDDQYYPKSDN